MPRRPAAQRPTTNPQAAPGAAAHPDRHSLLVPPGTADAPFMMPSANRFREQYYWDNLFSLKGLLACGLADLARVRRMGMPPGGGREHGCGCSAALRTGMALMCMCRQWVLRGHSGVRMLLARWHS